MDFMKLISDACELRKQREIAKRRLLFAGRDTALNKGASHYKQQYASANRKYEDICQQIRKAINHADDKEAMWAIFFRRVKRMPWDEVRCHLHSNRSEIDVQLVICRYLRQHYRNWAAYSDCF